MNAAFRNPDTPLRDLFGQSSSIDRQQLKKDSRDVMLRSMKSIPVWGWAVIAVVVLVAVFGGLAEEGTSTTSGNCYYDAYGNYQCS